MPTVLCSEGIMYRLDFDTAHTENPHPPPQVAEDLAIDIPKFWQYLAEILAPSLLSSAASLTLLRDSSLPLAPHLSERYVAAVLGAMVRTDEATAVTVWTRSGLAVADLGVAQPQQVNTGGNIS